MGFAGLWLRPESGPDDCELVCLSSSGTGPVSCGGETFILEMRADMPVTGVVVPAVRWEDLSLCVFSAVDGNF